MNRSPKFSILLPTHNRADIIEFAIESVLAQTEQDFELLIAGDGCTDNTTEVIQKYLKDERIKWFDLPKAAGFGYANRNVCLKQAKGEYVAFIAHDDLLFPDHLEILGKIMDENKNVDIACSRAIWVDSEGLILPSAYNLFDSKTFDFFMNKENGIPSSCFVHRRSCFDKVGYWNDSLPSAADYDLWKRIINSGTNNYYFETRPTTFHFKAIWRSKQLTFPGRLSDIASYINENPDIVPEVLRVKIPEGEPEQKIFWQKIKDDEHWLSEVRKECLGFSDRLVQFELPSLISHASVLQQQNYELRLDMQKFQHSVFYKIRRGLLKLFPSGSLLYRFVSNTRKTVD